MKTQLETLSWIWGRERTRGEKRGENRNGGKARKGRRGKGRRGEEKRGEMEKEREGRGRSLTGTFSTSSPGHRLQLCDVLVLQLQ